MIYNAAMAQGLARHDTAAVCAVLAFYVLAFTGG